ncbi:hypothetical protein [Tenacibaculum maritimum]
MTTNENDCKTLSLIVDDANLKHLFSYANNSPSHLLTTLQQEPLERMF